MDLVTPLAPGPLLAVLAAALVAAAGVAVHAWRRPGPHRGVRLAAGLAAVAALAGLAVQPARRVPAAPSTALVLTPGAGDAADALARRLRPAGRFRLPGADGAGLPVADVAALRRRMPGLTTLHVAGHGLTPEDAAATADLDVVFHAAPRPDGLRSLAWDRAPRLGTPFRLAGTAAAPAGTRLVLEGPGARLDSVTLGREPAPFVLQAAPPDTGALRYVLHRVPPRGPARADTLTVHVRPPARLRVLVLRGAPDFETRHLAEHLGAAGAALAVRTAVSRDVVRTSFLNRPATDLARLTPALLDGFDVVSADARALAALGAAERAALEGAVRDGLGLLLTPDAAGSDGPALARALVGTAAAPDAPVRTARLAVPGARAEPVPVMPATLAAGPAIRPLVHDEAGATVAAVRAEGLGRVGLALPQETFRWRLAGDTTAYAGYWTTLLSAVARADAGADRWSLPAGPVRVDRPLELVLETTRPRPLGLVATPAGADTVFLVQDPLVPERWRGRYWPREAGLHAVATPGGTPLRFGVDGPDAWPDLDAAERRAATQALAARPGRHAPAAPRPQPVPIPPLLFFLLFVASAAVLWIAERR